MISALSIQEFKEIMNDIHKNHSLIKGRCIKYIDWSFDFRTNEFYRVTIRPFGSEPKEFTTVNRVEEDGSLFEEIVGWLYEKTN